MSRSPVISTLLILTLCIVCEVMSAPREELIRQEFEGEKFLETREAEVLERRSGASRYENFRESREEEMRRKRMTLVPAPRPSVSVEEKKSATKKPIVGKPKDNSTSTAENSEAKDMTQTYADPKDDDDSEGAETVPEITDKNSTSVGQQMNKMSHNNSVETPKEVNKVNDKVEETKDGTKKETTVASSESPSTAPEGLPVIVTTVPSTAYVVTSEPIPTSSATSASTTSTSTSAATDSPAASTTNASITNTTDAPTITTMNPSTTTTMNPSTTTTMNASTTTTMNAPTITTMNAPTAASSSISTEAITSAATSAVVTTPSSTNSQSITDASMTSSSTETYSGAAEAALHAKHSTSMPPGVVALVIAIAFACLSVMAYIGLVVWRRYLEWRYGNRELLVNEFDANDISNFEL